MLSFLNQFKHGQEMRESKDEILVGELVRAMARLKTPAIGFNANTGAQMIQLKPIGDPILNSIVIIVDRKTGGSMIQQAVIGSKATIQVQAEVKNYLSDPDDLVAMYRTDIANIFKMPMLGDVKLDHAGLGQRQVALDKYWPLAHLIQRQERGRAAATVEEIHPHRFPVIASQRHGQRRLVGIAAFAEAVEFRGHVVFLCR